VLGRETVGSIAGSSLGTGEYCVVVCRGFRNGPESGMLQLGWWPTWWMSILLSDAYRRGEASDEIGGRVGSREEKDFITIPIR